MGYENSAKKLQRHIKEIENEQVEKPLPDLSKSDEEYEEGKVMDLLDYPAIRSGEAENPYMEDGGIS
jgi:hypothetical protein